MIRMLFTAPTMIPGDWTRFEADTGLKMEDTVIKDDPGIFLTEVEVNDAGDRFDLISTLSGVEQSLIDGGYITQAETRRGRQLGRDAGQHQGDPLSGARPEPGRRQGLGHARSP